MLQGGESLPTNWSTTVREVTKPLARLRSNFPTFLVHPRTIIWVTANHHSLRIVRVRVNLQHWMIYHLVCILPRWAIRALELFTPIVLAQLVLEFRWIITVYHTTILANTASHVWKGKHCWGWLISEAFHFHRPWANCSILSKLALSRGPIGHWILFHLF